MILKILDYKEGKEQSNYFEEWSYFDNIENASNYYDEEIKSTVVRCYSNGVCVTFAIPYIAYLMSDSGKTFEKIVGEQADRFNADVHCDTLQDAAIEATK